MYEFCTYFDHRYLPRALALYSSLKKYCSPFRLTVLALSTECSTALLKLNLPNIAIVDLQELEGADTALLEARKNRSLIEYYFTLTPSWMLYLFEKFSEPDSFTYLDADLFFFSDPAPLFEELNNASIGIIGHRFPPELKDYERFGIYNVGLLFFRRDSAAKECLQWWRERCLEWCYDRAEGGRFADQKYLDDWPGRFRNVTVVQHKGAGVAPWNVKAAGLDRRGDLFFVDGVSLIFYHFHGLQLLSSFLCRTGLNPYETKATGNLKKLYTIYLKALKNIARNSSGTGKPIRYAGSDGLFSGVLNEPAFLHFAGMSLQIDASVIARTARYLKRLLKLKQAGA